MSVIDELKITQAFRWRNGANVLRASIVILFLFAFQLAAAGGLPVWAMQKLPVFQGAAPDSHFSHMALRAIGEAGYKPRLVREEDFLFHLRPADNPYVLVPLSNRIGAASLGVLSRYAADGGRIILLSSGEAPDPSVQRLVQLIGLNVTGTAVVPREVMLYWHGAALPGADVLHEGSRVLTVQPGLSETVLATWGNQYPAIITTEKGALLNWPWGRQLSQTTTIMALSKVMPLAKPDSIVFAEPRQEKRTNRPQNLNVPQEKQDAEKQNAEEQDEEEPDKEQPKAAQASLEPDYSFNPAIPVKKALIPLPPVIAGPNAALALAENKPALASKPPKAVEKNPVLSGITKPMEAPPSSAQVFPAPGKTPPPISARQAEAEAESEVLNNILGEPASGAKNPNPQQMVVPKPDDPLLKDKLGPSSPAEGPAAGQPGKPFSFLDPEAAEVVAPEFDYGTYSYNLRILDDYNRRINDALETSRQLALDVPEEKVRAILKEAYQHKRKFESLYLGNQTQAGLEAYAQARRLTLQALALTSASPRVEGRAIWLDRGTIVEAKNPVELRKLMLKLRQAGINIVYFETLNAGFPIYPSGLLKRNPMVQGWDPLKAAVEEGHKLGMEVHAWVWAFAVGNRRHNPLIAQPDSYPGPVLADGGLMGEALRNRDGGLNVDNRQNEYWLDPASEKGRALLLSVYKEIVSNYDVDGLHLDYIRYPFQTSATRMGFDPVGRERFYRATGQSLDTLDDYTAKLWIAWKTYQVSSFVQQVSTSLRAIKPDLRISAAVFPMKRESRIVAIQQDWETWIDNGWVDTLSPMSYTSDPQRLQGMFDYVRSSPQKRSLIYPGIALHRLDGGQLVQQLEALRQHGGLGATLFAGAHLNQEKIDTLGDGPFKEQNSIPPHKDVVKSLQLILDDYRQKFGTLQAKGALTSLPVEQAQAITGPIAQLNESLTSLSTFKSAINMPTFQLNQAQQQLSALQSATDAWLRTESLHPFRAQYFNQKIILLTELLGYLVDKNKGATTAFSAPVPPPVAARPAAQPTSKGPSVGLPDASVTAISPVSPAQGKPPATSN